MSGVFVILREILRGCRQCEALRRACEGRALVPVSAKVPLADEQQEENDGDTDRLDHSQGNHLQVVRHGSPIHYRDVIDEGSPSEDDAKWDRDDLRQC